MTPNAIDPGGLGTRGAPVPWTIDKAKGVVRVSICRKSFRTSTGQRATALPSTNCRCGRCSARSARRRATRRRDAPSADRRPLRTRVLLPVYEPGALLFLGHGLARHGDGDVTGTGIETTLDVEFSVEVVKKKEWPHSSVARASTIAGEFDRSGHASRPSDYVMAVGSATTLQRGAAARDDRAASLAGRRLRIFGAVAVDLPRTGDRVRRSPASPARASPSSPR